MLMFNGDFNNGTRKNVMFFTTADCKMSIKELKYDTQINLTD